MNTKNLPTKNNLIKIKNSIKQSKEGQMLLEQKRIILKKEKEKYIDKAKKIREDSQKILDEAIYNLKIANMEIGIENMTESSINRYCVISSKSVILLGAWFSKPCKSRCKRNGTSVI